MLEFWQALVDPHFPFLRMALAAALIGSIPAGLAGSLVVARRTSYLAAAIAHAALGGLGAALYARHALGWAWAHPQLGALVVALAAGGFIARIEHRAAERSDTLISAIWVIGMATGLLFLHYTPASIEASALLFGDILLVTPFSLGFTTVLAVLVTAFVGFNFTRLKSLIFDEEFARLRGIHTGRLHLWMTLTIALTVVALVQVMGVVLLIAVITIPAAIAGSWARNLKGMMLGAVALAAVLPSLGMAASYSFGLPAGPAIALTTATAYVLHLAVRAICR